ncbi:DUF6869 domain-containing protein [Frateuria sp. GZRe12]|uniref:DUF6869 domain-containing protein n=1 Tax=Frateuria sp. GZRe12 TaxID=3351533 RepID=UPI003EDC4C6D
MSSHPAWIGNFREKTRSYVSNRSSKILGRIDCSSPNPLLAALAAGPLEDLLAKNGGVVVDRVEMLARRNPHFRLLLNGVWGSSIKPQVLSKLAKYRDQRW